MSERLSTLQPADRDLFRSTGGRGASQGLPGHRVSVPTAGRWTARPEWGFLVIDGGRAGDVPTSFISHAGSQGTVPSQDN